MKGISVTSLVERGWMLLVVVAVVAVAKFLCKYADPSSVAAIGLLA